MFHILDGPSLPKCSSCCPNGSATGDLDFSKLNFSDSGDLWIRVPAYQMVWKSLTFAPVIALGVLGNLSIIVVMALIKKMRNCTNLFILNMAIADLITVCMSTWIFLVQEFYQNFILGPVICKSNPIIQVTCLVSSVFSLIVISLDRLLGITRPFSKRLTKRSAVVIMLTIWVLSAAVASPLAIWRDYKERQWADVLEVYCMENPVSLKLKIYWSVIIILLFYLPLSVVTLAYTIILLQLDRFEQKIVHMHLKKIPYRRKVIRMLFLYVLCLFWCWFLLQLLVLYRHFRTDTKSPLPKWHGYLIFVGHLLAYLNSAINPILYGACNDNFRRAFRLVFCRIRSGSTETLPSILSAKDTPRVLALSPLQTSHLQVYTSAYLQTSQRQQC